MMRTLIVAMLAALPAMAYGQPNRALEQGSAAAARQAARSSEALREMQDAKQAKHDAELWRKVTDAKTFAIVSDDLRRKQVAALYKARESTRAKKGDVKTRNQSEKRIATLNKSIIALNDPAKPYIPDGMPDSVKRRIHLDEIQSQLIRTDAIREWTTKDGKSVSGALLLYDAGKVTVKSIEGKTTVLKLVDLSPEDWDYVAQSTPAPKRVK